MAASYRIKLIRCESGERLPLLLNQGTGLPLWDPTLFILTELRATNRASATLSQATRAIMVGHQIFEYLNVDLNERLSQGRLLDLGEIDTLAQYAGLTQTALDSLFEDRQKSEIASPRIVSLERARMGSSVKKPPKVAAGTKAIRLMYIRDYIAWLVASRLLKSNVSSDQHRVLSATAQLVIGRLDARIPSSEHKDDANRRQGVSAGVRARILEVIDPNCPENPWKNKHVRLRNQLIFLWLLLLGLRNGELLGVRVSDINFRASEVIIVRRPDDPTETRKNAPNVKTKGRLLALSPEMTELTRNYVMGLRATIKGGRRHPFLIVATGTGKALTKSALNKLFRELRTKVAGLQSDLSPHVLRHTWNDDFSELMDARAVSAEDEERMRKQAMGWSDSSKMAAYYTKRHVQRKSNEASLAMQATSFKRAKEKD